MVALVQRHGDLFPLHFCGRPEPPRHVCGRSTQQRICKRAQVLRACNETIWSLNSLAGHVSHSSTFLHVNQAQSHTHALIRRLHSEDTIPASDSSPEASLKAMLKSAGGYSSAAGVLANYVSDTVSLPFDQLPPRRVESMVSEEVADTVVNFSKRMLLSDAEAASVLQNTELPGCYVDPVLQNSPQKYAEFVVCCHRCHLVRFDVKSVVQVGLFFVTKKPKD